MEKTKHIGQSGVINTLMENFEADSTSLGDELNVRDFTNVARFINNGEE